MEDQSDFDHPPRSSSQHIATRNPLICIVGPTATGKSAVAQALAEEENGEIVSADSMQVYRGMDIGTGKVPPSQRTVPYHGIDLIDPGEPFSVALYQPYARKVVSQVEEANRRPVLCGGTGLYVRGVIDAYDYPEGEQRDNPTRHRYETILEAEGAQTLWERLSARDPESAALIHPHNTRRVIRAFELIEEGSSYARQKESLQSLPQIMDAILIGLAVEPAHLRSLIDARIDDMREAGLIAEVETLLGKGFHEAVTAPQAIGYKEIVAALEGRTSMDEAFERVKIATHRYAKRQRSWFGRDARIQWIDADSQDKDEVVERALDIVARMDSKRKGEA